MDDERVKEDAAIPRPMERIQRQMAELQRGNFELQKTSAQMLKALVERTDALQEEQHTSSEYAMRELAELTNSIHQHKIKMQELSDGIGVIIAHLARMERQVRRALKETQLCVLAVVLFFTPVSIALLVWR